MGTPISQGALQDSRQGTLGKRQQPVALSLLGIAAD